jgi:hypothetical protein
MMNERIKELAVQADLLIKKTNGDEFRYGNFDPKFQKFAELLIQEMHRKVIASILITDVVMEEKGQVPTSEDYIRAINNDFGVEK